MAGKAKADPSRISHGLPALLEKAVARKKLTLNAMIEADSYRAQISLMEEG